MTYRIVPADLRSDRADVLALWARNLPGASHDRFVWLYEQEPTASARCWVLRDSSGAVVGSTAVAGRVVRLGSAVVRAGQAVDLAVDREHRSLGPAVKLQRALVSSLSEAGLAFAYAFPNRQSEPILARAGYVAVGAMERWTRPLSGSHVLRGRVRDGSLARMASWGLTVALRLGARESWRPRPTGGVDEPVRFDDRFDELWIRAAPQFGLVGERTSRYLSWRFGQSPDRAYRAFTLASSDGRLRGYVVYREADGIVRIADLLADRQDWGLLIAGFLRAMRDRGVSAVSMAAFDAGRVRSLLTYFGFRRRTRDTSVLVSRPTGAAVRDWPDPATWHLTEADRDV